MKWRSRRQIATICVVTIVLVLLLCTLTVQLMVHTAVENGSTDPSNNMKQRSFRRRIARLERHFGESRSSLRNPPSVLRPEPKSDNDDRRGGEGSDVGSSEFADPVADPKPPGSKGSDIFNLGSLIGPLLRHALLRNNHDNLGIRSSEFVHADGTEDGDDETDTGSGDGTSSGSDQSDHADYDENNRLFVSADPPGSHGAAMNKLLRHLRPRRLRVVEDINASEYYAALGASEPLLVTHPSEWCAGHNWTLEYMRAVAGSDIVGVETSKTNRFYSNEGLRKVNMTVGAFLDVFNSPQRAMDYYLAEEGLEEMPRLEADLTEPDFAAFANVDKRQIWVGAGGQVSPLHHDQWDNVLCQMQGERTFILFDPLQVDRLYPKSGVDRHFSFVDPEHPDYRKFPDFRKAVAYRVDVKAGQMLVVPAFWWHQVHHAPAINVAINFWYVPSSLLAELLYDILLPDGPNNEH